MAAGSTLVLEFANDYSNSVFFSYPFGNSSARLSDIKTAMNAFITNGEIFRNVPVSIKSAKVVITTETEYDLSE